MVYAKKRSSIDELLDNNLMGDDYHLLLYPPPPPLELLDPLSSLSFATETEIALPSISLLFKFFMASLPSSSEEISTKPNPRYLPVALSVITFAEVTSPYLPNMDLWSSSVV